MAEVVKVMSEVGIDLAAVSLVDASFGSRTDPRALMAQPASRSPRLFE
jgi:hypothetical protein